LHCNKLCSYALRVALEHAILVALTEKASTGYDLARRFDKSIGQFWTATHQQVYKVLARMEGSGWVHCTVVTQHGRPDKKVYDVTGAGRAELAAWISLPAEPEATRSELAVKIRGAAAGELASVLAEVARHRALHADRLEAYLANEMYEFADPDMLTDRQVQQWLVLRGGIGLERSLIDWYDDVLATLATLGTQRRRGDGLAADLLTTVGKQPARPRRPRLAEKGNS
jgi:DNA-binding PadR family transcriptional regulator